MTKHAVLEPVKGLLLVTSVPSGAQILCDGKVFGLTPKLIDSLDAAKAYTLVLKKEGYRDYKCPVNFSGRTPYALDIPLVSSSGILRITTQPDGARVSIDGMDKGESPQTVEGVPEGRMTVTVTKDGWLPQSREVVVRAGDGQECHFDLKPKPGVLRIVAKQPDAFIYVNGDPMGKSPVEMANLEEGEYTVRVECDGCAPEERRTFVSRGKTKSEEFDLASVVGGIYVRTIPSGATVLVDGRILGKTAGPSDPSAPSDLLTLADVKAGRHTLTIRRRRYSEYVKQIEVKQGEMLEVRAKLKRVFSPDIRLTTLTGVIEGELVRNMPDGSYVVETAPGVERIVSVRDVRLAEPLDVDGKGK